MKDIEKAKELLTDDLSLVLVKDESIIISNDSGIKPFITYIKENIDLKGYSLADKIVGKAQAMLCVYVGVKEVFAKVLSESGKRILEKYQIPYSYDVLTKEIINRKGNDICPMEKAVKNIEGIDEAVKSLIDAYKKLD